MKYTLTDKTITILEHILFVAEKSSKIVQFCFIKGKKQCYINPQQDIFVTFELDEPIKFDYPIGLDTDWYTMSNYGVAVKITKNYVPLKHKEYSALNAKHIGSKDDMIPVPATFLINKEGKIIWMHYNPDYRRRPDVNKILEQL